MAFRYLRPTMSSFIDLLYSPAFIVSILLIGLSAFLVGCKQGNGMMGDLNSQPPDASTLTQFYKVPYALCAQQFPDREFLLVSYGSNGLDQMGRRLDVDQDIMKAQSYAGRLTNYARGFFGKSPNWNEGSVATVIPEKDAEVFVITHKVTHDPATKKFKIGGKTINMPVLYAKEGVESGFYKFLKLSSLPGFSEDFRIYKDGEYKTLADYPVWIFVGNLMRDNGGQKRNPTPEYIKAIQNMLMDRRELMGAGRDSDNLPDVDVRLVGPEDIAKQL